MLVAPVDHEYVLPPVPVKLIDGVVKVITDVLGELVIPAVGKGFTTTVT